MLLRRRRVPLNHQSQIPESQPYLYEGGENSPRVRKILESVKIWDHFKVVLVRSHIGEKPRSEQAINSPNSHWPTKIVGENCSNNPWIVLSCCLPVSSRLRRV
jgi:hypothetical protein